MTTNRFTVPSRLLCPITKAYNPDTPLEAHMFIADSLSPATKMHLEWAWGLKPHQMVIKNVQNCIGCTLRSPTALNEHKHFADRSDILENSINGDFVLVPTMTTLNKMLAYFSLPCDTARVYHTRTSGAEFIKYRRITFKEVRKHLCYSSLLCSNFCSTCQRQHSDTSLFPSRPQEKLFVMNF